MNRLQRLIEGWLPGGLTRPTFILGSGAAAGQICMLVLMPVATRIYGPEAFGVFAVYAAIAALEVAVCFGFDRAIQVPRDDIDALSITVASVALGLFSAVLIGLLLVLAGSKIVGFIGVEGLRSVIGYLPWGLSVSAVFLTLTGWSIRAEDFRGLSAAKFAQYLTMGTTQVGLGLWHASAQSLVVGQILGYMVSSVVLLVSSYRRLRNLGLPSPVHVLTGAWSYRRYAIFGAPSNLLNSIALQFPALAMGMLYGSRVAGWYSLAQRAVGAPTALIAVSLWQAMRARLAAHSRATGALDSFRSTVISAIRIQGLVAAVVCTIAVFGPVLFSWFFGSEWQISGVYLRYIIPWIAIELIVAPLHAVFDVKHRPDLHLRREILRIGLLALVFFLADRMNISPAMTLFLFTGVAIIVYSISLKLVFSVIRHNPS